MPPAWTDAREDDPGIALLKLLAYLGDTLSCFQDRAADESRLRARLYTACSLGSLLILFFWRRRKRDD